MRALMTSCMPLSVYRNVLHLHDLAIAKFLEDVGNANHITIRIKREAAHNAPVLREIIERVAETRATRAHLRDTVHENIRRIVRMRGEGDCRLRIAEFCSVLCFKFASLPRRR